MSENNEPQRNKRKRKKSFLKNARKYAKKGHFGCGSQLESDTYQYFVKIMEVYREGFENDEDKKIFVDNVFQQTENQEIQCSCNQIGCRVIEMLLPFASDDVMKKFMDSFGKELRPLCSDKFASHILEELVTQSCKRSSQNIDMKEEYKEFTLKISKFLLNNLEDFLWDPYANHIIRTCLQNLSNIPKEDPKSKDNDKKKLKEEAEDDSIVPEYADVVIEYGERLLTWPQFPDLCKNEKTSGFLQILLKALKKVSSKLLKKYMKKLLECFAPEDDNADLNKLPPVFLATSSLMVLEVYLQVAPKKYFSQIYIKCFAGRLFKLSKIRNTNFAVQKLITHCQDKSEFESMFDELADHFSEIIKEGHTGVIWAIADGCKRLTAKQGPFVNSILKSLNCLEPESKQSSIVICLARMKTFEENTSSSLSNEELQKTRLNLHGTLILQILLEFNKPIKIVNSLLEMETNTLKALLSNTMGSHIVDSFVKSQFVGEKSREKLVRKMKGTYQDLAATKFGSRSFEAIWNAAGLKHKMAIMDELCYKDGLWSNSDHGKIIANKIQLSLYKKNKEEWKNSWHKKKDEVLKLLEEVAK
ncbi:nucleolar protein 9 [Coccinella septempunctata]|uniref:nucleolar protein 9 n=1 Tax=Coccinella septempunctata TaxID=41139 RepID=UPI001D07E7A6|nr:nucleolar protein 9 [Coccinella septempunctata]